MTAETRKPISKRTRFEVFKRDMFSCQYCGKKSPDVVLHVDHIKPVSKGGKNTITNLITACQDCNLGKSNIELSDDAAVKKQMTQVQAMAERDEQITMMVTWQESLISSEEKLVISAEKEVNRLADGFVVSDAGRGTIRKAIKKHGYESVMSQISSAYSKSSCDDDFRASWSKFIGYKFNGDAASKLSIHYAKGILKNRFHYFNEKRFYSELGDVSFSDKELNYLIEKARVVSSPTDFIILAAEVISCR
jgi:hypothetical protein